MGALRRQATFIDTVQPRALAGLMLGRTAAGDAGHELPEPALMGEGTILRPDVTFVLFLNGPDDYRGGTLSLGDSMHAAPPAARSLVCVPTAWPHRFAPVVQGTRITVTGWLQSLVRDAQVRELLHDLAAARTAVHAAEGNSRAFELLNKSYANLLRRYAET
jgi:PKHD-type hydroxylase